MAMIYATTKSTAVTAFEAARGQIGNLGSKVVTFSKTTNGKVALGITAATTLVALVAIGYGIYKIQERAKINASVMNANDSNLRCLNHVLAVSKFENGALPMRENTLQEAVKHEITERNQTNAEIAALPQKLTQDLIAKLKEKEELTGADQSMLEALKSREAELLESARKSQRGVLKEVAEDGVLSAMSNHPYETIAAFGLTAVLAAFVLGNSNNK